MGFGNGATHRIDFFIEIQHHHIISRNHHIPHHQVKEVKGILNQRIFQCIETTASMTFFYNATDFIFCISEIDFIAKRNLPEPEQSTGQKKTTFHK